MAVSESEPRKMANCFLSSGYCQWLDTHLLLTPSYPLLDCQSYMSWAFATSHSQWTFSISSDLCPQPPRTHRLFRDLAGSRALQRKVLLNSSFTRQ